MRRKVKFLILSLSLVLTACGQGEVSPDVAEQGGKPIECAPSGAREFNATCYLVGAPAPEDQWVVRHQDGSFHRLESGDNPAGLAARNGASEAEGFVLDGYVYLTIEHDRYRWKASSGE